MYLHIGDNAGIDTEEIIGIFDLEATTTLSATKRFFEKAEEAGEIVSFSDKMPKSFILAGTSDKVTVYVSCVGVSTLRKRLKEGVSEDLLGIIDSYEQTEAVFIQEDIINV